MNFRERLASKTVLVADGATGSNLQARGLPQGMMSELWLFDQPEKIQQLHSEFIAAGADIILTCTFNASPLRLEASGVKEKMVEINRLAVQTARRAVGNAPVFVGGSIGPSGQLLKPFGPLEEQDAVTNFTVQAMALAEAGVDLLVIETQFDLGEARAAAKAVRAVSDIPLVVSFSYDRGRRSMMGVKPAQMAQEFASLGVDMLGVNCGKSLDENLANLVELRAATDLPIWFKPNAGLPHLDAQDRPVFDVTPEEMGAHARQWVGGGAQVVGGCCGTSPQHLAEIARAVKNG